MVSDPGRADAALTSLRDLVRHVGHDLNNHLASVIVHLSLATGSAVGDADRLAHTREALDAARSAAQLARQLFIANRDDPDAAAAHGDRTDATDAPRPDALAASAAGVASAASVSPVSPVPSVAPVASSAPVSPVPTVSPAIAATSATAANAVKHATGTAETGHGSLLVLEDDESVAMMMQDVLSHFGYDVVVTQSPEACVTLYDQARHTRRPFDLVVLDLTIRGGTRRGIDTLAALRLIDPNVRAVAHSGDPEADIMKDPRRYGFTGAIRKPTPLAQLSRIMQRLMAHDD